jgi:CRISPR-associated endonuclease/helicase Cas3
MDLSDSFKLLQNIVYDLANAEDGMSTGELVRKYEVSRQLIAKYMDILSSAGIPIYRERKRHYLDPSYSVPFTLTPDEAAYLVLTLERSLTEFTGQLSTVRSLYRKLSAQLPAGLRERILLQIDGEEGQFTGNRAFAVLAEAVEMRREVLIDYQALRRKQASQWQFRPYQFTANALSDGIYVLGEGCRDGENYVRLSLKVDRIVKIQFTDTAYDIIDLARLNVTAQSTWGVWHTEQEPISVVLQFDSKHYDRLLESRWHPTQHIHFNNSGYVIFTVEVAAPEEMVPWIRSWGSGVTILEPETLRRRILATLKRQIAAYGLSINGQSSANPKDYLWAKYDRSTGQYHPLLYHLIDVAALTLKMWDLVLSPTQRTWLAQLMQTDEDHARAQVAVLAGLHDIGKATPGFQRKAPPIYDQLISLTDISDEHVIEQPHGILSARILQDLLANEGVSRRTATLLALAIGGHHGTWITDPELKAAKAARGNSAWHTLQSDLFVDMMAVLGVDQFTLPVTKTEQNIFAVFLSGLVSVCDWIGSSEEFFPYTNDVVDPADYLEQSLFRAEDALTETGWLGWQAHAETITFERIFPFQPNAMQAAILEACNWPHDPPRLVLIEYLTGGGKTEIALYLADLLINQFGLTGSYVAMPTQATSNQMFGRVSDFLAARYPYQQINLQLLHGQAEYNPRFQTLSSQPEREGDQSTLQAEAWFLNRRRALLAPFGVGTIDQAMLAVLQTRHHFVRQFGLSQKVVIFDEIHAYDAYMNEIIVRLLNWLSTLTSPAILLSATLPLATRQMLLEAVGATLDNEPDAHTPYPRLTVVRGDGTVDLYPLPAPESKTLHLYHLNTDDIAAWLAPIYVEGGCIAIICNTVDEAIATADHLVNSSHIAADDVMLFHARMPQAWRQNIEHDVLDMFGKDGTRPVRKIIVATQIIEQSLDLDFDLMISRTAPVDLLIQRAGRLHRHLGRDRPPQLQQPTLILRTPPLNADGLPDFGVDAVIYAEYILMKSWEVLRERETLTMPDDLDQLMESVYTPNDPEDDTTPYQTALTDAYRNMVADDNGQGFRSGQFCIGAPDARSLIGKSSFDLPDDEQHVTTRNIGPGTNILCLGDLGNDLGLPTLLNRKPTRDEVSGLLQYRLTIRKKKLLHALKAIPIPEEWSRIPQLKHVHPVIFQEGVFHVPDTAFRLYLSPFYGLSITEEDA